MNLFKIIKYQLYLLQLENYELGRYFRLLFKKGLWPRGQEQRKQLVWTTKARALFVGAVVLHITFPLLLFYVLSEKFLVASSKYYVASGLLFILLATCYILLYTLVLLLMWPLDFLAKQIIIHKAKSKILNLKSSTFVPIRIGTTADKKIKIIGIAGSYGKTTMKAVLTAVISEKFKVKSTPESVNTPVGISRWILKNVDPSTEILIVEMGEHYRGDIKDICNIVKPDISVVTGINESHLERMGKMDVVIETIFEVVSGTKAGGMVVLNADDHRTMENYKQYVWPDHRVAEYKVESIKYEVFNTEKLGWDIKINNQDIFVSLLGEYALGNVDAAVKVGRELGMSNEEIKKGIEKIKPVEHRLQPIKSAGGILVIDDAYNGNPDGVREAIKVLSRFENRRKVFITPGLVEMGKASAEVHRQIGKELAGIADVVVLIKNSVTSEIESGIMNYESGIENKPQIIWFNTAQEAHSSLKDILKPGDVVVFQNDWGDNYI